MVATQIFQVTFSGSLICARVQVEENYVNGMCRLKLVNGFPFLGKFLSRYLAKFLSRPHLLPVARLPDVS